jgi:hypothetical protein
LLMPAVATPDVTDAYIGGRSASPTSVDSIKKAAGKLYRQVMNNNQPAQRADQVPQLEGRAKQYDQPFLSPSA